MAGKSRSRRRGRHEAYRSDYFVTVVDFMPGPKADGAFKAWLIQKGLRRDDVVDTDIDVEERHDSGEVLRRYRVHREVIPPSA